MTSHTHTHTNTTKESNTSPKVIENTSPAESNAKPKKQWKRSLQNTERCNVNYNEKSSENRSQYYNFIKQHNINKSLYRNLNWLQSETNRKHHQTSRINHEKCQQMQSTIWKKYHIWKPAVSQHHAISIQEPLKNHQTYKEKHLSVWNIQKYQTIQSKISVNEVSNQ